MLETGLGLDLLVNVFLCLLSLHRLRMVWILVMAGLMDFESFGGCRPFLCIEFVCLRFDGLGYIWFLQVFECLCRF